MLERVKPLVTLGLLAGAAGIVLSYSGFLEPTVTPAGLPSPTVGGVATVALVVLAVKLPTYIDGLAWKRAGRAVGLTADGGPTFESGPPDNSDKTTLTSTVDGRPVRARVHSTNSGQSDSGTTTTVVETELQNPVDWHATFFVEKAGEVPEDPEIDAVQTRRINGLTVTGDIPAEIADSVATRRVRDAVTSTDGAVSVGDVTGNLVDDMTEKIEAETDGVAETLATGLMDATDAGADGPDPTVKHRNTGLCTDESALESRIDAVTAVADAVERAR